METLESDGDQKCIIHLNEKPRRQNFFSAKMRKEHTESSLLSNGIQNVICKRKRFSTIPVERFLIFFVRIQVQNNLLA